MSNLSYFNTGWRSTGIARELVLLKNKKNYEPNFHLIKDSLGMLKDMQTVFVPLEEILGKIKERVFYDELFFGRLQSYEGPTGLIPDYSEMKEYVKRKINSQNLIKKEVSSATRTIEKILAHKIPSKNELSCAAELFDYITDECLSQNPRGPYGQLIDDSRALQGLAA